MVGRHRIARVELAIAASLIASTPLLLGQGCLNLGGILGVAPSAPSADVSSARGALVSFEFIEPRTDVTALVGDIVSISWTDEAPTNAVITLLLDPDLTFGNGNEIIIAQAIMEDEDGLGDRFELDTASLAPATYRVIARINDGTNPELVVVAEGKVDLFGVGTIPGNHPPAILVTQPGVNLSAYQGDTVDIAYCGSDADDGKTGQVPDVVLLLDLDDNPNNDLDLTGQNAEAVLAQVCAGGLPLSITGAIVVGCAKDDDCAAAANATVFPVLIDVRQIPTPASGQPYRPRATMWDHTNRPVHAYARGSVSITSLASAQGGEVDLGAVGRTLTGSRFLGLNAGGLTGSNGAGVGDIDADGAEDFVILSRFGRGYEVGNFGTAHVVLGLPTGQKFGAEVPLNSVSTIYRGSLFYMPPTTGTEGLVSVCRIGDVTGDDRPDILFGAPYIESFPEDQIDGPCGCDPPICHFDLLPNPLDAAGIMTGYDWREDFYGGPPPLPIFLCSNDLDLNSWTPIDGGYTFLVASDNLDSGVHDLASSVNEFEFVGSHLLPVNGAIGARFRGAWWNQFDFRQVELPYAIAPHTRWGQTIRTMPPMTNTSLDISPLFGTTQLISSPDTDEGRGWITLIPDNAFIDFIEVFGIEPDPNSISFPVYDRIGSCAACGRAIAYPGFSVIVGESVGDHLGYAGPAGDYNLDGSRDILCGAPGADRRGLRDNGAVYIIFGRPDYPSLDLNLDNPPRMEIHGTREFDQYGQMQALVGDINQDGLPDMGIASQYADTATGQDAGFIGILFGGRALTGEGTFTVDQIGTAQLPGVRIEGAQAGGHAGALLDNAGDFNGDGIDDMVILAPGETRTVDGQLRRGIAYLVFGGPHLTTNQTFNLSQVGTSALPGIVFVSPYIVGTADEAPIDFTGPAGDVNADGYDDLLIGLSTADYVNPLAPSQRRIDAGECYLIYGNNTGPNAW